MRFHDIREFGVEDLLLDEGNYRFKKAANQQECVAKIYSGNTNYFKGLLKSIAEDDIGEPLLVYVKGKSNIVLDGNRRLAVLKVLLDDSYLPAESLRDYVEKLRKLNVVDFSNIQAQVSSNKTLIMRTVYERHAGGKTGKARIAWNAYASARFGYFEEIGGSNEWHFIALLTKTEEKHPNVTKYLDGNKFSYETFRRLMREAFKRELISPEIFSSRNKRVKTTAPKNLVADAIAKTLKILKAMKDRKISLSRGENFADKDTVERFFDNFSLSPDAQRAADAKAAGETHNESDDTSNSTSDNDGNKDADDNEANPQNDTDDSSKSNGRSNNQNGIAKSEDVETRLKTLGSKKLIGLYKSLEIVSLERHPQLMYVGAWSFFEVLSKIAGNTKAHTTSTPDFPSFFRQKMKAWNFDAADQSDWGNTLDIISKYGNSTKHSKRSNPVTAIQLRSDFFELEPLILKVIDEAISQTEKKKI